MYYQNVKGRETNSFRVPRKGITTTDVSKSESECPKPPSIGYMYLVWRQCTGAEKIHIPAQQKVQRMFNIGLKNHALNVCLKHAFYVRFGHHA